MHSHFVGFVMRWLICCSIVQRNCSPTENHLIVVMYLSSIKFVVSYEGDKDDIIVPDY